MRPAHTVVPTLRRVGVVGAGVIGVGVAQALAQTHHEVVLVDVSDEALARARRELRRNVRSHHLVASGEPLVTADVVGRVRFTCDYQALQDVDFAIENATESWAVKREIFEKLDRVCRHDCVLAANTSVIPITKIGSATARADRVVGIHFMNPVPLKPVVEVVRGRRTSDATLERTHTLLNQMKMEAIVVGDSPGFVSNRVLMLTVNEAAFLVHENVASAGAVDGIFKRCFGHPMGPLETADLIGLDTILLSIEGLYEEFADSKYRPCPLLRSMVAAGMLGRKSGVGFYEYGESDGRNAGG